MTVAICARNATGFVARAVESAERAGADRVLLIDDYSEDGTAEAARGAGGGRLKVVRPRERRGLGNARQAGVEAVETEFLVWLDADDELLPGRLERLRGALGEGADVAFDAAVLADGPSGRELAALAMPPFLRASGDAVRLFERNYLPGPAWPGVRTAFARRVGYDAALPTGEDLDFNLRAYRAGGRFAFLPEVGYRQHAYRQSLSRDRAMQLRAVAAALSKHGYEEVAACFAAEGLGSRVAGWALVSMALFRGDWAAARRFLDRACPPGSASDEILEPLGPLPLPEGWRRAFFEGVLELLDGSDPEAAGRWFGEAERARPTPEAANNLGVALWRAGRREEARRAFERALERAPAYADAQRNLRHAAGGEAAPEAVTTHPLRRQAARQDYGQKV